MENWYKSDDSANESTPQKQEGVKLTEALVNSKKGNIIKKQTTWDVSGSSDDNNDWQTQHINKSARKIHGQRLFTSPKRTDTSGQEHLQDYTIIDSETNQDMENWYKSDDSANESTPQKQEGVKLIEALVNSKKGKIIKTHTTWDVSGSRDDNNDCNDWQTQHINKSAKKIHGQRLFTSPKRTDTSEQEHLQDYTIIDRETNQDMENWYKSDDSANESTPQKQEGVKLTELLVNSKKGKVNKEARWHITDSSVDNNEQKKEMTRKDITKYLSNRPDDKKFDYISAMQLQTPTASKDLHLGNSFNSEEHESRKKRQKGDPPAKSLVILKHERMKKKLNLDSTTCSEDDSNRILPSTNYRARTTPQKRKISSSDSSDILEQKYMQTCTSDESINMESNMDQSKKEESPADVAQYPATYVQSTSKNIYKNIFEREENDATKRHKQFKICKRNISSEESSDESSKDEHIIASVNTNSKRDHVKRKRKIYKSCPLSHCGKSVTNITRHLTAYHKMSSQTAKKLYYAQIENYKNVKGKHSRHLKQCPICVARVQRLDQHLRKTHQLTLGKARAVIRKQKDSQRNVPSKEKHVDKTDGIDRMEVIGCRSLFGTDNVSDLENALERFKLWLESFSGGRKKPHISAQYCSSVKALLCDLGIPSNMRQLRRLVTSDGYVDRKLKEGYKPGTVKAYLCALRLFYSFFKTDRDEGDAFGVSYEFGDIAIHEVTNWMMSLKEELADRKHNYAEEECRLVPIVAKVMENYADSQHFTTGAIMFHAFTLMVPVSSNEFTHMRDCIIMQILIRNGQRAGAIRNALTSEYEQIMKEVGGEYILKVKQHKTAYTYGSARLCLNEMMNTHLTIYYTARKAFLRQVEGVDQGFLFCSLTGQQFGTSRVSQIIKSVGGEPCMTTSRMRKATVVTAKEAGINDIRMSDLATHMTHSTHTQQLYYDVRDRDMLSLKAVSGIEARQSSYPLHRRYSPMHETTEILASEQQEINDLDSLHDGGIPTDPGIMTEIKETGTNPTGIRDLATHMIHSTHAQQLYYDVRDRNRLSLQALSGIKARQHSHPLPRRYAPMHETTETPASEQQEINDLNGLHDESIQMDPGLITEVSPNNIIQDYPEPAAEQQESTLFKDDKGPHQETGLKAGHCDTDTKEMNMDRLDVPKLMSASMEKENHISVPEKMQNYIPNIAVEKNNGLLAEEYSDTLFSRTSHGRRAGYTPFQTKVLQKLFKVEIRKGSPLQKSVSQILSMASETDRQALQEFSLKQIADKLRCMFKENV